MHRSILFSVRLFLVQLWVLVMSISLTHALFMHLDDSFLPSAPKDNHDSEKTVGEYVLSYGHHFECHKVLTPDDYILTVWRIPRKLGEKLSSRQPLLLMHGLLDNSFGFLVNEEKNNLVFQLIEDGYDVWLGNVRGGMRSTEHLDVRNYDHTNPFNRYWDFSLDEMALLDLPSMIDYILDYTNYSKLTYIAHSQGATLAYLLASSQPIYIQQKVDKMVHLSPLLFMANPPSFLLKLISKSHLVDLFSYIKLKNFMNVPGANWIYATFANAMPELFYKYYMQPIVGYTDTVHMDMNRMGVLFANEPGGTSTRAFLHLLQNFRNINNTFHKFDFGDTELNIRAYGSPSPPLYDLKVLKTLNIPFLLISGEKDSMSSHEDLGELFSLLPPTAQSTVVPDYSHTDLLWGTEASSLVFHQLRHFIAI